MKNKLLMVGILFSILLSGCGSSADSSPATVDNVDTWEDDSEYEETDTNYEEDTYEESEEVVVKTYPLTELTPFSEDRAWVKYDKDGIIYTGIIDTDGNVLYESDGDFEHKSQFLDGLSFYVRDTDAGTICGIVDIDGNLLYESEPFSDGGYKIAAYGEGHFLVTQHIVNFDIDEWRYGTIDKNGEILNEIRTDELLSSFSMRELDLECKYIGEGFIEINNRILYHIETGSWLRLPFGVGVYGDFYDGYTIVNNNEYNSQDAVINADFRGVEEDRELNEAQGVAFIFDTGYTAYYSEGLALRNTSVGESEKTEYGYYNIEGNLVISLEQYQDKEIRGGYFCGGYAPVIMKGADNNHYVSVIDSSGNLAYQPIKIDFKDYSTFNVSIYESLSASSGYLQATVEGEKKIISPDGTIYIPGIDNLSMLNGLTFGYISGGFMTMNPEDSDTITNPCYISLDANTIIDSVKVTSTDMDTIEDESWNEETSDASYIVPDSYDITGKWKSIGDSGFGQAQPGAIVVFDGNNCNFYSPNDTYAFYKEDDKYVLDITSVLGESLSQTVNIIDDDNIEIAGASLKRIE